MAILTAGLSSGVARAQESAAEFNRREFERRSAGTVSYGGPRSGAPVISRPAPVNQRPAPVAPSAPPRDFFSALFGVRSAPVFSDEPERPRIVITPGTSPHTGGSGDTGAGKSTSGIGTRAFCVRTCDGRYFPLPGRPTASNDSAALAQCSAFCPAAKMEFYYNSSSDGGIEGAVNRQGKAYVSMPNAFAFRERLVEDCTCTGDGKIGGMGRIDVKNDTTLKRGDVVMTASGAQVFVGSKSKPPFRDRDFVKPERFPELPKDLRQRISELRVL